MKMHEMPGFLKALRTARSQRPDLPVRAFRHAADTREATFKIVRCCPGLIIRWAEWYALGLRAAS